MTDSTAPRPRKGVSTEDPVAELERRRGEIVFIYGQCRADG